MESSCSWNIGNGIPRFISFSDWIFSLEQCITLMLGQISAAVSLNSTEFFWNTRRDLIFSLTCLLHVPPIPSMSPFPWDVTENAHASESFRVVIQLNVYRCLKCFAVPSLCKVVFSNWILGCPSLKSFKNSLKITTTAYLSWLTESDKKNVRFVFQFIVLVMNRSSEQSTGLVFPVCTLSFILENELIIFTEIKVDNDWLIIETLLFIFEWQGLTILDKIMKKEMLQFHIECVKDICYSSFQFNLFKMATLFKCLLLLLNLLPHF